MFEFKIKLKVAGRINFLRSNYFLLPTVSNFTESLLHKIDILFHNTNALNMEWTYNIYYQPIPLKLWSICSHIQRQIQDTSFVSYKYNHNKNTVSLWLCSFSFWISCHDRPSLLQIANEDNTLGIPKNITMIFPADKTVFALVEAESPGKVSYLNCSLVSGM